MAVLTLVPPGVGGPRSSAPRAYGCGFAPPEEPCSSRAAIPPGWDALDRRRQSPPGPQDTGASLGYPPPWRRPGSSAFPWRHGAPRPGLTGGPGELLISRHGADGPCSGPRPGSAPGNPGADSPSRCPPRSRWPPSTARVSARRPVRGAARRAWTGRDSRCLLGPAWASTPPGARRLRGADPGRSRRAGCACCTSVRGRNDRLALAGRRNVQVEGCLVRGGDRAAGSPCRTARLGRDRWRSVCCLLYDPRGLLGKAAEPQLAEGGGGGGGGGGGVGGYGGGGSFALDPTGLDRRAQPKGTTSSTPDKPAFVVDSIHYAEPCAAARARRRPRDQGRGPGLALVHRLRRRWSSVGEPSFLSRPQARAVFPEATNRGSVPGQPKIAQAVIDADRGRGQREKLVEYLR
jgi:hypothetical protein